MVEGSFVQNVAYSLSGNAVVLGIGFLLTPFIARIYGPATYGQFALFTAIAGFIQPFSTLQFPSGFVAMKEKNELTIILQITFLSLIVVTTMTMLTIVSLEFSGMSFSLSFQVLLLLPIYILFSGVFNIGRGLNINLEEFKRGASAKSIGTLMGKMSTIGFGLFITPNVIGMIFGGIVGFIGETFGFLSKGIRQQLKAVVQKVYPWKTYSKIFLKFTEYPIFVTTNTLVTSLGGQLPILVLSLYFQLSEIGIYSLSLTLVTIPINLIGISVGSVFLPKISDNLNDPVKAGSLIKSLYRNLYYPAMLGLLILAGLYYYLLPIILGNDWVETGRLASLITIGYSMQVMAIPLSVTYRLLKIERVNLMLAIYGLIGKVVALVVGIYFSDFYLAIALYILIGLIQNSIQVFFINDQFSVSNRRHFINSLASIALLVSAYTYLYS